MKVNVRSYSWNGDIMELLSAFKKGEDIYELYEVLGWNDYLKLTEEQLTKAMDQSYFVINIYEGNLLVGTGRVVSDGIINGYICGIGVHPNHRKKGYGTEILKELVSLCELENLNIQLFCEDHLKEYYLSKSFKQFAIGMKYKAD